VGIFRRRGTVKYLFYRNFFVSALVLVKNSKTALLFQKIAEIPYFFRLSGTPPLGVAGYPKK